MPRYNEKMSALVNNDDIYVYSSFKQFCLPILEFLVP